MNILQGMGIMQWNFTPAICCTLTTSQTASQSIDDKINAHSITMNAKKTRKSSNLCNFYKKINAGCDKHCDILMNSFKMDEI